MNIETSETNRGKEQIIVNRKYLFNISSIRKDNSKVYKCIEYRTLNKCKSFIILNDKREIIKCGKKKKSKASLSITKHKIKDEIRNSSSLFDVKLKRINDKISQDQDKGIYMSWI